MTDNRNPREILMSIFDEVKEQRTKLTEELKEQKEELLYRCFQINNSGIPFGKCVNENMLPLSSTFNQLMIKSQFFYPAVLNRCLQRNDRGKCQQQMIKLMIKDIDYVKKVIDQVKLNKIYTQPVQVQ